MSEVQKSENAQREEKILAFWKERDIFNKSLQKDAPQGDFIFYDGPPFATGLPHYGHIVASVIKDVVPRYWTMRGYHVPRVWGWDCHGLPIENIVEKELGFKHKKDILKMGIAKFNELCRERVLTYAHEWEKVIPRIGRWADMEHAYRTMDKPYMESVWWVFKQLYDKGLVYEDYRSMHICPRCETTLSQQEVSEGYKDVKDLSVTVKFKIKNPEKIGLEGDVYLLAWTTTPWTLPGNVALAVGSDIEYLLLKRVPGFERIHEGENPIPKPEQYLVSKAFFSSFPTIDDSGERKLLSGQTVKIHERAFYGHDLLNLEYEPPFDYYAKDELLKNRESGWKVYEADFVTTDTGTGIVHIATAFGEDDMRLGKEKSLPFVQHVNMDGTFRPEVKDFAGMQVKPIDDVTATDVEIIKYLAKAGTLFAKEKIEHSYPHCWRCDTPLLNYATTSWFVSVTKFKDDLLKNAESINWSPAYIKEGRFGKWLEGARDWSVSRQRFWASVMPIWVCEECKKQRVFGSAGELEEASGQKIDDLHKHIVDDVTVSCSAEQDGCGAVMRRVPDVLDTWFDSGSMPYGEMHYPFENKEEFERTFPAQFIAEGLDQTRAWFYYLHVLAGALFNKNAFQNVIVNGIVLAEDGKKMSKKLKNYPDPMEVVEKYGADALRLYLLTSPVVQAENLNFSEKGVDEMAKKNIGRLANVLAFYKLYEDGTQRDRKSTNVLDQWILARVAALIGESTEGYDAYQLDSATRPLALFIDDLSVWYIRRSRDRFKSADSATSSASLRGPTESSAVSAYTSPDSVSPRLASEAAESALNTDKRAALATLRYVLHTLSRVMAPSMPFFAEHLFQAVREEEDEESVHLAAWPEIPAFDFDAAEALTKMFAVRFLVSQALEARDAAKIKVRQPLQKLTIPREVHLSDAYTSLIADEVNVKEVVMGDTLALDTDITKTLREEGFVRDTIRAIQAFRKESGLKPGDNATYSVSTTAQERAILEKHLDDIQKMTTTTITFT